MNRNTFYCIYSLFKENIEAYIKSFWAYGIYGWLIEWMKRGMPESGDELYQLFKNMNQ